MMDSSKSILIRAAVAGSAVYLLHNLAKKIAKSRRLLSIKNDKKAVIITGCDSGLGYSSALHCQEMGFQVFAGVLNVNSSGSISLNAMMEEKHVGGISVIKLDVTSPESVQRFLNKIETFSESHPDYSIHALMNNAGVMVFGEFEWQTEELMLKQLSVNLIGAMRVTKAFLPLLRKNKGRIINMSTHCAIEALPGLSVYAASKSGLQAWNNSIRVEYGKYGVKVSSLVPGSFVTETNILSKQQEYAKEMKAAMTPNALEFYSDYFDRYNAYLAFVSGDVKPVRVNDKNFYNILTEALTSENPSPIYYNSTLRYEVYFFLMRNLPVKLRDYFSERFVQMPKFNEN